MKVFSRPFVHVVFMTILCIGSNAQNTEIMNVGGDIVMTPSVNGSLMVHGDVYADGAKLATENTVDEKIVEKCECFAASGSHLINSLAASRQEVVDAMKGIQNIKVLTVVTISAGGNITNLDGLAGVTFIGGSLTIRETYITNTAALSGITFFGGSIQFSSNSKLVSLDGLSSVTSIGGPLLVTSNNVLTDLNGLANLTTIGGHISIHSNAVLTDINGLASVTHIESSLNLNQPLAHICLSLLNRLKGLATNLQTIDVIEDTC